MKGKKDGLERQGQRKWGQRRQKRTGSSEKAPGNRDNNFASNTNQSFKIKKKSGTKERVKGQAKNKKLRRGKKLHASEPPVRHHPKGKVTSKNRKEKT